MKEEEETASTSSNSKQPSLCEECKTNPSKYKCPACSFRTCSLPCVKAHKKRNGCTGKKTHTQFVPLSQFDDNILLSDYNLLEEVKRVSESAQRLRYKLWPYIPGLRNHLQSLYQAARARRTKLLLVKSGMTKRRENKSRYDQRKKCIYWTIEWRFHSTDVVLVDHGVSENMNLSSIVKKHLELSGPWNHPLRKFCDERLDNLRFFVRKYPKILKSPFRELDINSPIRQQFSNLVILEYPVIYVFLPSHKLNFEVVGKPNRVISTLDHKNTGTNDNPIPEGVSFKEEEIEEDNSTSNTRTFDLTRHMTSGPEHQIPSPNQKNPNQVQNNSSELSGKVVTGNSSHSSSNAIGPGIFEDLEFDFDQGLIDSYSNLIAEINPDDFLDLEGLLAKDVEMEERSDLSGTGGFFSLDEEIEEGEIIE